MWGKKKKKKEKNALAGSRTRIYCLEGNNANRYTTNAGGEKDPNLPPKTITTMCVLPALQGWLPTNALSSWPCS